MQRQKMSLLKAHLRHPRYNTNYSNTNFHTSSEKNIDSTTNNEHNEMKNQKVEDVRVKYEPGVILKVSFTKPIESDKIFKVLLLSIFFICFYSMHILEIMYLNCSKIDYLYLDLCLIKIKIIPNIFINNIKIFYIL